LWHDRVLAILPEMPTLPRSVAAVLAAAVGCALGGCGARTRPWVPPPPADAAIRADAGGPPRRPDAGTDSGTDAGPPVPAVPCERDRDCAEGLCAADRRVAPVDLAPLELACAAPLGAARPRAACTRAQDCDHGICLVGGSCTAPCVVDADCPTPAAAPSPPSGADRCVTVYAQTGSSALQPVRGCVSAWDLPGGTVTREDRTWPLRGLDEDRIELRGAPRGQAVWVIQPSGQELVAGTRLQSIGGAPGLVYDATDALSGGATPINPVGFGTPLVVRVPIGSELVASDEGWLLDVVASEPSVASVIRVERPDVGTTLAVNVFYVGVPDGPTGTEGPYWVAAAMRELARAYAPAGIRVVLRSQREIVGALRARFGTIELDPSTLDYPELTELFALSAGAAPHAVNVFLVRMIDEAQGVAGGIPGPPGMQGTAASGVAIAAEVLVDYPDLLGFVFAHELGHYLGLFHTSEAGGAVLEPLTDTPECRPPLDTDGDGTLTAAECAGAGADNLMFWAATLTRTTPEQGRILRAAQVLEP